MVNGVTLAMLKATLLVAGLVVLVGGCVSTDTQRVIDTALTALDTSSEEGGSEPLEMGGRDLLLNVEPAVLPDPLRVGQPLVISVDPVFEGGISCAVCTITWDSDGPTIARWTNRQVSGNRRSATLVPATPGYVELSVELCPGPFLECTQETWRREVRR